MPYILLVIVLFLVVGAITRILNKWNELNAARNKSMARPASSGGDGTVRQTSSDMDRFLAEIDRLRKKSAEAPPAKPKKSAPVAQVVQPVKKADKPRARVVAELAELPRADTGFSQPVPAPTTGPLPGDLPMAMVVSSETGAPATKVTRFVDRPRPLAKTPFAKSLTGLLASGQGLALAIVLQEILGPRRGHRGGQRGGG